MEIVISLSVQRSSASKPAGKHARNRAPEALSGAGSSTIRKRSKSSIRGSLGRRLKRPQERVGASASWKFTLEPGPGHRWQDSYLGGNRSRQGRSGARSGDDAIQQLMLHLYVSRPAAEAA